MSRLTKALRKLTRVARSDPGSISEFAEILDWQRRDFAAPSPWHVKIACLLREGLNGAIWVETGTYMGRTALALSKSASKVITIEPEPALFDRAKQMLASQPNIEAINGLSELVFPQLLPRLVGHRCNFWLDGHFSAGTTHKGPVDTPIREELAVIANYLSALPEVVIFVDDVRCFEPHHPDFSHYPNRNYLVNWATQAGLVWHIEHDIFVAKKVV